jgi:hypothetical protein
MGRASGATPVRWQPILIGDEAAAALALAADVARRVCDVAQLDEALASSLRSTDFPRSVRWQPDGLWQGNAGLALLCSAMDASLPGDGWDRVGHEHLTRAARAAESASDPGLGLSSGLGGLGLAARALSRGGARYRGMLDALDARLADLVSERAAALGEARPHGVSVSTFDVISGLTGAGRYLLLRRETPACRAALESVLTCLVELSQEDRDGVPHWYTPPRHLGDSFRSSSYPDGNLNLGLAHGVPGPLALLSLAAMQDVCQPGQLAAVDRIAGWLRRSRVDDEWGVNFPTAVAVGARRHAAAAAPSRAAWCYGTPGVARALWLAGCATDRAADCELAVQAMEAVYRRPLHRRRIDGPTFCHGVAGLLQVTLRFARDCELPVFGEAARRLCDQLVSAHEPDTLLGYRNLEPTGKRTDQPGLLAGAAGVALVLLAASMPAEPVWDCAFLLS